MERRSRTKHKVEQERERAEKQGNMTKVTLMLPWGEEETRKEGGLRKFLKMELAQQRVQMEEMEDEMQQTED